MNSIKSFYKNHSLLIRKLSKIFLRVFFFITFLLSFSYVRSIILIILIIFIFFDLIKQKCYTLFFDMLLLNCLWICSLPSLSPYYYIAEIRFQIFKESYNKKIETILPELNETSTLDKYDTDLLFLSSESYVLYAKQKDSILIFFKISNDSTGYIFYSDEKAQEWLNFFNYATIINTHWAICDMFPMNYPKDANIEFTSQMYISHLYN